MPDQTTFVPGTEVFAEWSRQLKDQERPVLYQAGEGTLSRVEIGPGRIVLLGGAPGAGKTALATQLLFDALRLNPELRALCCNVEMAPAALLDRQCARLSGINLKVIRRREFKAEHQSRLETACTTLQSCIARLAFLSPPFDLRDVAQAAEGFAADLIVLDYIQRILPPDAADDNRRNLDATMNYLRAFATRGLAILAIAAVGRSKDRFGRNSYAGESLSLASFRGSSELEFGADDAYVLATNKHASSAVRLLHLKSRYGEASTLDLHFDRAHQSFTEGQKTLTGPGRMLLKQFMPDVQPAAPAAEEGGPR